MKNKKQKIEESLTSRTLKWGMLAGLSEAVYIGVVAVLMDSLSVLAVEPLGGFVVGLLFFLLFFVFSAVISVTLVFGRPLFLILEKKYQEAVTTLFVTILSMLILVFFVFLAYFIFI